APYDCPHIHIGGCTSRRDHYPPVSPRSSVEAAPGDRRGRWWVARPHEFTPPDSLIQRTVVLKERRIRKFGHLGASLRTCSIQLLLVGRMVQIAAVNAVTQLAVAGSVEDYFVPKLIDTDR